MNILQVNALNKIYRTKNVQYQALKHINCRVSQGEFVAVMGPSGSGKTTLLNIISGFLSADSGEVLLGNKDMLHVNKDELADIRQEKLGFIFQDFMLVNGLTVKENIFLPQIIAEKSETAMQQRTHELMKQFGIEDLADKYPNEISGGQKQRVAISRALANHPLLILADEPTGNLDSKSGAAVIESFLAAQETLNATILMVTHDPIAASYSDRILFLSDGEIIQEMKRTDTTQAFRNEIMRQMGGWKVVAQ